MQIIFARHGNTFNPGDGVIWIGRTIDLPLVAKGREQARDLARALAKGGTILTAVCCGSLQRTRTYAQIVIDQLGAGLVAVVDRRLDEIDYGKWTGLTREEVVARLGQGEELARWDEDGVWPANAGWGGTEADLRRDVREFTDELIQRYRENDVLLVVSTHAILRYLGKITVGGPRGGGNKDTFKMKTGNIGKIKYEAGSFELVSWNVEPDEIRTSPRNEAASPHDVA